MKKLLLIIFLYAFSNHVCASNDYVEPVECLGMACIIPLASGYCPPDAISPGPGPNGYCSVPAICPSGYAFNPQRAREIYAQSIDATLVLDSPQCVKE